MPKRRFDGMPRVTLKNINRVEDRCCGWRVHIKRRRREFPRYFPDGPDGPFESLRAAIVWRDEQWAALGSPTHVPSKPTKRTSTGILGVSREVQRRPSGAIVECYRAAWTTAEGGRGRRSFDIDKYGEVDARLRAIAARKAGEEQAAKQRELRLKEVLHMHDQLIRQRARGDTRQLGLAGLAPETRPPGAASG